jgi:hypothetical protein
LARRAAPGQPPPRGLPVPFTAAGSIASPHAFPLTQGGGVPQVFADAAPPTAPPETHRLPGSGAGDTVGVRRSRSQVAALFARAVAQGQRNL